VGVGRRSYGGRNGRQGTTVEGLMGITNIIKDQLNVGVGVDRQSSTQGTVDFAQGTN